jgi:hypothetical protein
MPPFSLELRFERPTKRTVRFHNEDFGTVYVPNTVYEQLGRPEILRLTLDAVPALQAVAA